MHAVPSPVDGNKTLRGEKLEKLSPLHLHSEVKKFTAVYHAKLCLCCGLKLSFPSGLISQQNLSVENTLSLHAF